MPVPGAWSFVVKNGSRQRAAHLVGHADARVGDFQHTPRPRPGARVRRVIVAALGHGVHGVENQVGDDLAQLGGVAGHVGHGFEFQAHGDLPSGGARLVAPLGLGQCRPFRCTSLGRLMGRKTSSASRRRENSRSRPTIFDGFLRGGAQRLQVAHGHRPVADHLRVVEQQQVAVADEHGELVVEIAARRRCSSRRARAAVPAGPAAAGRREFGQGLLQVLSCAGALFPPAWRSGSGAPGAGRAWRAGSCSAAAPRRCRRVWSGNRCAPPARARRRACECHVGREDEDRQERCPAAASARSCSMTPKPSRNGIDRSSSTRSGSVSRDQSRALDGSRSCLRRAGSPARWRIASSRATLAASSSITRSRMVRVDHGRGKAEGGSGRRKRKAELKPEAGSAGRTCLPLTSLVEGGVDGTSSSWTLKGLTMYSRTPSCRSRVIWAGVASALSTTTGMSAGARLRVEAAHDLVAGDVGQVQVEQDQVRADVRAPGRGPCGPSVAVSRRRSGRGRARARPARDWRAGRRCAGSCARRAGTVAGTGAVRRRARQRRLRRRRGQIDEKRAALAPAWIHADRCRPSPRPGCGDRSGRCPCPRCRARRR